MNVKANDCWAIIRNVIPTAAIGFVMAFLSPTQSEARDNVVVRPNLNCKCICTAPEGRVIYSEDITAVGGTCEEARDLKWKDGACNRGLDHGTMFCREDKDAGSGSSSGIKPSMPGVPRPPVREKQP